MMDVSTARDWLAVIATILSIGSIAYTWLTRRSAENTKLLEVLADRVSALGDMTKANTAELESRGGRLSQAEKKLVDFDRRIQAVESDIRHMPDHEQIAGIRIAMTKLDGGMQRVEDMISAQVRAMQRVEKHLFEDNKGPRS